MLCESSGGKEINSEFDRAIDDYFSAPRHSSPNKRLIAQKQSTSDHKHLITKNNKRTQHYGIHYTAAPGVSYVIEPLEGQIDYKVARQKPVQFYE